MTRGGAELQLCRLAAAQAAAGNDVTIVTLRVSAEMGARLSAAGVRLIDAMSSRIAFPVRVVRATRRADVVHAWMYHAFVVAAMLRLLGGGAHVWGVRRTDPISPGLPRRTRAVVAFSRRWSRRRTDGIVYCSEAARTVHERFGFDPPAAAVIPNSIELPPRPEPRTGPVERFGMLARWSDDKGIDVALDAWAIASATAPAVTFTLAGPGLSADNSALRDAIEQRGVSGRVVVEGSTTEPMAYLAGLDCLVSASRTEGFPNVVAEAMAVGIPVIATDVGGTVEVLGECGQLVPAEDAAALARAMSAHCIDPDELRSRASGGPERARQFTIAKVLEATDRFYDQVKHTRRSR